MELLPCPFCGSNEISIDYETEYNLVMCSKCTGSIDSIEQWNTRHSPWISLKDIFPENGEIVLCRLKNYKIHVLKYEEDKNFTSIETGQVPINIVTHWMEIPSLPKPPKEI